MSDYENILISAVRYALGRMTYIVDLTVNYIIKEIEVGKISKYCMALMLEDIKRTEYLGMDCDAADWHRLENKIKENLNDGSI